MTPPTTPPKSVEEKAKFAASELWFELRLSGVDINQVDIEPALQILTKALIAFGDEQWDAAIEASIKSITGSK